jgi:hypothetical protein
MSDLVTFVNNVKIDIEQQAIHTKTLDGNNKSAEISPEDKKAYLCEVKKLAENVSCGDENYCQWITKNFGKTTKGRNFMVHLFYKADKKDSAKAQKRPVFAVKVKIDNTPIFEKKSTAQPDKKVSLPQVCEDAKDCVIPRVWTDDMDDCVPPKPHKLDFIPLSLDGKPIGAAAAAADDDDDGKAAKIAELQAKFKQVIKDIDENEAIISKINKNDDEGTKAQDKKKELEAKATKLEEKIQVLKLKIAQKKDAEAKILQLDEKVKEITAEINSSETSDKSSLEAELHTINEELNTAKSNLKAKKTKKAPSKTPKTPKEHEIFVENAKSTNTKLTFCVRDEAVGQVAFAVQALGLTQYFEKGCIINCYQNEKNLNFCRNMGFKKLELGLYFNQSNYLQQNPQNMRLKRVCASLSKINLRFLPQFEYLDIGKNCRDAVRNLVMIPLIEKFYAENPHLVTSEVRRELGSQSCCYELARRTTGFFYTYSHNSDEWITEPEAEKILISKQMVRFNGNYAGNVYGA